MQQTNWDQFLNFASFWFSEIVLLQQRQENLSLPYQFWDFDWTYLDCHVHTYPGKCCPQTTNKMCVKLDVTPARHGNSQNLFCCNFTQNTNEMTVHNLYTQTHRLESLLHSGC